MGKMLNLVQLGLNLTEVDQILCSRCIVAFPASSEYEIDLQHGDVISLVKRRDDGWCKGTLHR